MFSFSCFAWKPINWNNLPVLNNGDISFTNNADTTFYVAFKPNICSDTGYIPFQSEEVRNISCPGANSVQIRFFYTRVLGAEPKERIINVPVNAHYSFGEDIHENPPGITVVDIRSR